MEEKLEIIKAVYKLNEEYWIDEKPYYLLGFEFMSEGFIDRVKFMGVHIWDSDNDDREFDENINDYSESYYDYFKKEALKIIEEVKLMEQRMKGVTNGNNVD